MKSARYRRVSRPHPSLGLPQALGDVPRGGGAAGSEEFRPPFSSRRRATACASTPTRGPRCALAGCATGGDARCPVIRLLSGHYLPTGKGYMCRRAARTKKGGPSRGRLAHILSDPACGWAVLFGHLPCRLLHLLVARGRPVRGIMPPANRAARNWRSVLH